MHKKTRLALESLEDRTLMSVWGMAWPNAGHLTASFVPDGTSVDGSPSALYQSIGSHGSNWQLEVLRALQTWAVNANINIGVVSDGGQAVGSQGLMQGDTRFGDIRISARPMGDDPLDQQQLAVTTPYTPLAGTQAGDMIFNSAQPIGAGQTYDLFTVALHEVGHVFGFADENTDPTSANYYGYLGPRTGLSADDIGALQALYGGQRSGDAYEGPLGNGSIATATMLTLPNIAADITTNSDADYYRYMVPSYAGSTVTIKVQTSGLSLLTPRLSVYNAFQQLVGTSAAVDALHGDVTITLNNVMRGATYYFKVEGASSGVFGIGGYRLKIDSGAISQTEIATLDTMLNGSIATVSQTGATPSTATALDQSSYATKTGGTYAVQATLADPTVPQFFSLTTPGQATGGALLLTVTAGQSSGLDPKITVYDANGQPVSAQILSNDGSSYVVQIVNPAAGTTYFVAVSPDAAASSGNTNGAYLLTASFRDAAIVLDTLVDGTLSDGNNVSVHNIQSTEFQIYHFVFSVAPATDANIVVQMNLYDENSNLVLSLTCQSGQTISANVALTSANYAARVVATNVSGAPLSAVSYQLNGTDLSDPMDPLPINPADPTLPPPNAPPPIIVTDNTQIVLPPVPPVSGPFTPPPNNPTTTASTTPPPTTSTTATTATPPPTPPPTTAAADAPPAPPPPVV